MEQSLQQKESFEWYVANFSDLYNKYGNQYIVILDSKVLTNVDTFIDGVNYINNNNLQGKAIVQKCGKDKSAYVINFTEPYAVVGA